MTINASENSIDTFTATNVRMLNSNTSVNASANFIYIPHNTFVVDDILTYFTDSNVIAITGLVNNYVYYVSFANSSGVALSLTQGGANVDIS